MRRMALIILLIFCPAACAAEKSLVLFDFESGPEPGAITTRDARLSLVDSGKGKALRAETGHEQDWPGFDLRAPKGKWDLSRHDRLAMDVTNTGKNPVTVFLRVDNPGANGRENCNTDRVELAPGRSGVLEVQFARKPPGHKDLKIIGMRGTPVLGPNPKRPRIDPSNVINLTIFVMRPKIDHSFTVDNIRAHSPILKQMEAAFLINALRRNNWNRLQTASQLGIHKTTLFRKIRSLGLQVPPSGKQS